MAAAHSDYASTVLDVNVGTSCDNPIFGGEDFPRAGSTLQVQGSVADADEMCKEAQSARAALSPSQVSLKEIQSASDRSELNGFTTKNVLKHEVPKSSNVPKHETPKTKNVHKHKIPKSHWSIMEQIHTPSYSNNNNRHSSQMSTSAEELNSIQKLESVTQSRHRSSNMSYRNPYCLPGEVGPGSCTGWAMSPRDRHVADTLNSAHVHISGVHDYTDDSTKSFVTEYRPRSSHSSYPSPSGNSNAGQSDYPVTTDPSSHANPDPDLSMHVQQSKSLSEAQDSRGGGLVREVQEVGLPEPRPVLAPGTGDGALPDPYLESHGNFPRIDRMNLVDDVAGHSGPDRSNHHARTGSESSSVHISSYSNTENQEVLQTRSNRDVAASWPSLIDTSPKVRPDQAEVPRTSNEVATSNFNPFEVGYNFRS